MDSNSIKTFSKLGQVAAAQKRHLVRDWVAGGVLALGVIFGIVAIESSAQALTATSPAGALSVGTAPATAAAPTPCTCSCDDLPSC